MTIRQLPEPCFVLDPSPWGEDEGTPHYGTHAKAEAALTELYENTDPDDPDVRPLLGKSRPCWLDAPCWVAECDAPDAQEGICGDTLGDEEEGPSRIHFETVEELFGWMPGEGWIRIFADGALCSTHNPDNPELPPLSPAEQEKAGQLVIPGVSA
jgi:hypothetical protein